MKYLSQGIRALMVVGLFVVMATSAAFAQASPTFKQVQPQIAREVVSGWDNAHPLEYYLALPVSEYVTQAHASNWDNVHPLEYYLAFPVGPQSASNPAYAMEDTPSGH